jgi:SAM-dependent methyltransferase
VTGPDVHAVVAGYGERARFARAETPTSPPLLLSQLLHGAGHVVEVPCGAGHFLTDYAGAGTRVTLIDANAAMLELAARRAAEANLPTDRLHQRVSLVQQLAPVPGADVLVVPNGALNQLAAQDPLEEILARLRGTLPGGGHMLLQVVCRHPDGGTDAGGFFTPGWPDGQWRADRRLDPEQAAGASYRERRQHHIAPGCVRIDLAYLDAAGTRLHTSTVTLRLIHVAELTDALQAAGLRMATVGRGGDRLTEVLATTASATPGRRG